MTYTPTKFYSHGGTSFKFDVINSVVDYFPYGKVLKEFVNGDQERYLTTQHEREQKTGLDYRGARYYDNEVARFLSTDPWQDKYPAWSTYNYVMGNPIMLIDPTGKGPTDWIKNKDGEYIWDNTVTNESQVKEEQTYVGKEDADIIKDLFGGTTFGTDTYDKVRYLPELEKQMRGSLATVKSARINTRLSVNIRANVTYNGMDGRVFEGIDFIVSASGFTSAPLQPYENLEFNETKVSFHGEDMTKQDSGSAGTIRSQAGTGVYKYSWDSERVYKDHGKSYDRWIKVEGAYSIGGAPVTHWSTSFLPVTNYTSIALKIRFNNK